MRRTFPEWAHTRSIGWSVPGMLVLLGGAYALLPPLPALDDAGARLALALR